MAFLRSSIYVAVFAIVIYALRVYMGGGWCHSQARIDGKTVIVTGANTGIGKETALDLARRGGRVILACRSVQRGEEAAADIRQQLNIDPSNLIVMKLDLSSLESVRNFVEEFKKKERKLHILINNAGVAFIGSTAQPAKTEDGFEKTFGINHLGHFLLTTSLLDILKQSAPSRIVTVSSIAHAWTKNDAINFDNLMFDNEYDSVHSYAQSKLANVMFSRHLGKMLEGTGITTYSLHPGTIRTEIGRHLFIYKIPGMSHLVNILTWPFIKSPLEGAQTQICCAVDERLAGVTGKYYSDCVEVEPATEANDVQDAQKLWDESDALVNL